jgi:acyl phosphate:glycerol-3-phosphate acyltransferase
MMDTVVPATVLLSLAAFWLGACPFALWIGKLALHCDVRDYGDGNPGATNVFRAGSAKWGIVTLLVELAKGFCFVAIANLLYHLPLMNVMIVALCAILGHAFSPVLRFHGGKALAVTGGALLAMPPFHIFLAIILFMALFYLFVKQDSWIVIMAVTASFIFFLIARGLELESFFILSILLILAIKHFADLKSHPDMTIKPLKWLHIHRQG